MTFNENVYTDTISTIPFCSFNQQSVGTAAPSSSFTQTSNRFTINTQTNTSGLWGVTQNFYYVYTKLTGSDAFDITVRLNSMEFLVQYQKGGLMIRSNLEGHPNPYIMSLVEHDNVSGRYNSLVFKRHSAQGESDNNQIVRKYIDSGWAYTGVGPTDPIYFKISRNSDGLYTIYQPSIVSDTFVVGTLTTYGGDAAWDDTGMQGDVFIGFATTTGDISSGNSIAIFDIIEFKINGNKVETGIEFKVNNTATISVEDAILLGNKLTGTGLLDVGYDGTQDISSINLEIEGVFRVPDNANITPLNSIKATIQEATIISSSPTHTNYPIAKAFDGDLSTDNANRIFLYQANLPVYVTWEFNNPFQVTDYKIMVPGEPVDLPEKRSPKDFKLQGSNDNSIWTDVDVVSAETGWTDNEMRTYSVDSPGLYSYYKFLISAATDVDTYISFREIELWNTTPNFSYFAIDTTATISGAVLETFGTFVDKLVGTGTLTITDYQGQTLPSNVPYVIQSVIVPDGKTMTFNGNGYTDTISTIPFCSFNQQSVGTAAPSSSFTQTSNRFTINTQTNTSGLWGGDQNFYYVYTKLTGSDAFDITVRLNSMEFLTQYQKGGLMIRSNLEGHPNPYIMSLVEHDNVSGRYNSLVFKRHSPQGESDNSQISRKYIDSGWAYTGVGPTDPIYFKISRNSDGSYTIYQPSIVSDTFVVGTLTTYGGDAAWDDTGMQGDVFIGFATTTGDISSGNSIAIFDIIEFKINGNKVETGIEFKVNNTATISVEDAITFGDKLTGSGSLKITGGGFLPSRPQTFSIYLSPIPTTPLVDTSIEGPITLIEDKTLTNLTIKSTSAIFLDADMTITGTLTIEPKAALHITKNGSLTINSEAEMKVSKTGIFVCQGTLTNNGTISSIA